MSKVPWKVAVWDEVVSIAPNPGDTFRSADLEVTVRLDRIMRRTQSKTNTPPNSISEVLTRQLRDKVRMIQPGIYKRLK